MNLHPNETQQVLGNICVGLAAIIYAIPFQHLLSELSRKSGPDNGGGLILGLVILVPMWLLLASGLLILTGSGGFGWLRLGGIALYAIVAFAAFSLAAISSFLIFEPLPRPSRTLGLAIAHLLPVLTILLLVVCLNPRLAMILPIKSVILPWAFIAAVSVAAITGYVGYQLSALGRVQLAKVYQSARQELAGSIPLDPKVVEEMLATVAELDPRLDFNRLVHFLYAKDHAVCEAAFARLRADPSLIDNLMDRLTRGSVETRWQTLVALEFGTFTLEEQKLLAEPARTAMEEITFYEGERLNYKPKSEHRRLRKEGLRLFNAVAERLAVTKVEFAPVIENYGQAFSGS